MKTRVKLSTAMTWTQSELLAKSRRAENELNAALTVMRTEAKRRTTRGLALELPSPTQVAFARSGGARDTSKMDLKQKRAEFVRLKSYLSAPLSTVAGAKKFERETRTKLGIESFSGQQVKDYLAILDNLRDTVGDIMGNSLSYSKLLDYARDEVKQGNKTLDEMLADAKKRAISLYEEQEGDDEDDFVRNFFRRPEGGW